MTNKELFKQAIAEAKTIREVALVNAKAALEETLTPHLQSMLASKLEEMAKDEDEVKEEIEETAAFIGEEEKEEMDEELNLDEFLAELELEEGSEEDINEAKGDDEAEETEEPTEDEESEEGVEGEEEEVAVADLSIEDLKSIIKDIVDSELEAEEAEGEDEEGMEMADAGNNEDSIDLDGAGSEDEINLEELLAELDELDKADASLEETKDADEDDKDEMKEAIATIETLRAELNEVNLLNAKLLYVNKIFKAKNLSEDHKIKVINAFDKATTPNEAKLVFEALNESLATKEVKNVVKEGIIKGFASKPAGNAPSKQIVEVNEHMARMQKLAGITKY